MRQEEIQVVFDKYPPSAVGKYQLTLGQPYTARLKDKAIALYSLEDNAGVTFNVSTFGATYTNGGYWHIVGQTSPWHNE